MLKRFVLAASFAAGPALAATVPPLPDADRVQTYSVSAPTSVFAVPFAIYGDLTCSDIDVLENGTLQSPLTYTCGSASGSTQLPLTDAVVTLSVPLTQGTLQIVGDYRPRNLVMPTAPGITRYEFNRTINTMLAGMRETRAKAELATRPALYGFWDPGEFYPPNAVVGFGQQEWQASQGNVNQTPTVGSPYWTAVVSPPQQVTFNTPVLPGMPTSILAAPTVDIGTSNTHFINVVGSGTISSFGASCSASAPIYYVFFGGVDTLVQSAMLVLPGYANIVTATNDSAIVQCLGNGGVQMLSYTRYAVAPNPLPAGAVMAFNLTACPSGWITADGSDPTPPYNVNLRGVFVRGLDNGQGYDPGRSLNTYEPDQLQDHTHTVTGAQNFTVVNSAGSASVATQSTQTTSNPVSGNHGSETRPKNVSLLYCVKQ